eukprot:12018210-Alexandrium_andersonii.AAC.1
MGGDQPLADGVRPPGLGEETLSGLRTKALASCGAFIPGEPKGLNRELYDAFAAWAGDPGTDLG